MVAAQLRSTPSSSSSLALLRLLLLHCSCSSRSLGSGNHHPSRGTHDRRGAPRRLRAGRPARRRLRAREGAALLWQPGSRHEEEKEQAVGGRAADRGVARAPRRPPHRLGLRQRTRVLDRGARGPLGGKGRAGQGVQRERGDAVGHRGRAARARGVRRRLAARGFGTGLILANEEARGRVPVRGAVRGRRARLARGEPGRADRNCGQRKQQQRRRGAVFVAVGIRRRRLRRWRRRRTKPPPRRRRPRDQVPLQPRLPSRRLPLGNPSTLLRPPGAGAHGGHG